MLSNSLGGPNRSNLAGLLSNFTNWTELNEFPVWMAANEWLMHMNKRMKCQLKIGDLSLTKAN